MPHSALEQPLNNGFEEECDQQNSLEQDQQHYYQQQNVAALQRELDWLALVVAQVIRSYLQQQGHEQHWSDIPLPMLERGGSIYATTVLDWKLSRDERLALALVLAPHLRPQLLDVLFGANALYERRFSEFGGVADKHFSGFLPTGQTLCFLLSGNDPQWLLSALDILSRDNILMAEQVLTLQPVDERLPSACGTLSLSVLWLDYFISGKKVKPQLSAAFPAHPLNSALQWSDLVLDYNAMQQIQLLKSWLQHGETLMQNPNVASKIKAGYRALFYGPSGTGKTLTAALLAKSTGREIYRVDLSMVVSKYIGETEKNLAKVFDVASYKEWILFFDEADSLFAQRTSVSSANDRHANQQTGYLLQRIEDFPGVVILASNLKSNIDSAFSRRFQAMIPFTVPNAELRLKLWQQAFTGCCELEEDVDWARLAYDHELTGGAIINVLRYCALLAVSRHGARVSQQDIISGITRELAKDDKTIGLN